MFCILKLNFGEEYTKNHKITLKNSQTSFIFTIDFDPTLKNPWKISKNNHKLSVIAVDFQ